MFICLNILIFKFNFMKKTFTFKKLFLKKENLLVAAMFGLIIVFGCYEFKIINQPTEANSNSSFDVEIVMTEDGEESNDWTLEDGSLNKTGLFGVLLPDGWTIEDTIAVRVESADSLSDGEGGYVYPAQDYSADYTLAYSESQTTMLNDSTGDPPPGYYWWGATTTEPVEMAFFDSLHFTLTVLTDDKTGEFFLQYAVGDEDYWGRMPYDPETLTDPLPINISPPVGVNEILANSSVSTYPNPSYGHLNIHLDNFNGQPVEMMIYDIRGKQIMSGELTNQQTMLDLVNIAPGMYFLRLESGEETITRQFIKK